MNRFADACQFACTLHAQQVRKGTDIPYISHLLAVVALVWGSGGDEDQAIAALLHDAVEDQGPGYDGGSAGLRDEIRTRYGPRVLNIVGACTDADTDPKRPWRERKEQYIPHIAGMPSDAVLVSVADKLDNARAILNDYRTIGERLWNRFNGGREGTLRY